MTTRHGVFLGAVLGATVALITGCALTAWVSYRTSADADRVSAGQFRRNAIQLRLAIYDRLTVPVYGIEGLRGSINMLGRVPTAAEFRRAVRSLDMSRNYSDIYGFGYVEHVERPQLAAFTQAARAEYGGHFELIGEGAANDLWILRSIEPIERNRAALGFDIHSEPVRRQAIRSMLSSRSLSVSGPIRLRQAAPTDLGVLYLLPVFQQPRQRAVPLTHPKGAVVAAVDYERMLKPLDAANSLLDFSLVDLARNHARPVYPSNRSGFAAASERARFRRSVDITVGGRPFRLDMVSTPSFDSSIQIEAKQTQRIVAMGAAASALMAAVAWLLIAGRRRALDLAQSLTAELDQLATVARLTTDSVLIVDSQGSVAWANPGFTRLTGHSLDGALGQPLLSLLGQPPNCEETISPAVSHALATGQPFRGEVAICDRRGVQLWTELEIQPVPGRRGRPARFIVIQSNVTARRATEQALRESRSFLQRTGSVAGVGGWQIDLKSRQVVWSEQMRRIYEVPPDYQPSYECLLNFHPDGARQQMRAALDEAMTLGKGWDLELPLVTRKGRTIWIRSSCEVEQESGRPARLTGACQDVSRRKEAEIALEANVELLRVTLNSIGDAVVTTRLDGLITWMNPIAEALTGWPTREAEGQHVAQVLNLVSEETRHRVTNPVLIALRESRIIDLSINTVLIARDGTEYGIEDSAAPIRDAHGTVIGAVMVFHDVTASRALNRQISHQAKHDPLTGVANRIEFEERLSRFLRQAQRSAETGAVMFVDLDHFKLVNDTHGHYAGDELLCQIAALLQASVRRHDTVARLGGDEFAILLENCTIAGAEQIAQNICDATDQYRYVSHSGQALRVGASIGIMPIQPPWRDQHELLRGADNSCYIAKEQGRNRFHTWQAQDEAPQSRFGEGAWGARIENALDEHGFVLHAQRIIPISERAGPDQGLHCEVLLRMREDDGSLISPGQFIPAAERYQLASRIDRWVLQEVFDLMSDLSGSSCLPRMLAINLSGQSVSDRAFHEFVNGLISRAEFELGILCFEITETAAITNLADATTFLKSMREHGIRVALDDFGAGMSSFGYLKQLAVDYLKIDGQFVQGLGLDPLDLVSVRSFCGVADALGVQTVAEYVETAQQMQVIGELGVDFAQGYLLHRPEPLAGLLSLPLPG